MLVAEEAHCPNCQEFYPGSIIAAVTDEDGEERCAVCDKPIKPRDSDLALDRCQQSASHIGRLVKIYEKSLEAELCYRDGILKQISESLSKLVELDAELKSLGR